MNDRVGLVGPDHELMNLNYSDSRARMAQHRGRSRPDAAHQRVRLTKLLRPLCLTGF
jgi:hypothetical protein